MTEQVNSISEKFTEIRRNLLNQKENIDSQLAEVDLILRSLQSYKSTK